MTGHAIPYLPQELAWIEARKGMPRREAHALFCAMWSRDDVSLGAFSALCKRKGWLSGRDGRFTKGQRAHNKGVPMPEHVRAKVIGTAFKPGSIPHTFRGAGHTFTCPKDGYVYLIIHDEQARTKTKTRRVLAHKHLWEQAHGPLPKGMALKCRDGDRANTSPDNWEMVPRSCLPRLAGGNRYHNHVPYDGAPEELKPAIMAAARLEDAIRRARRGATQ